MENIIIGLLKSAHNVKLKQVIVDKLIQGGQRPSAQFSMLSFVEGVESALLIVADEQTANGVDFQQRLSNFSSHRELLLASVQHLLANANDDPVAADRTCKALLSHLIAVSGQLVSKDQSDELTLLFDWSHLLIQAMFALRNASSLPSHVDCRLFLAHINSLILGTCGGDTLNFLYDMQNNSQFCANYLSLVGMLAEPLLVDSGHHADDEGEMTSACLFQVLTILIASLLQQQQQPQPPVASHTASRPVVHDQRAHMNNLRESTRLVRLFVSKSDKLFEMSLNFLLQLVFASVESAEGDNSNQQQQQQLMHGGAALPELLKCFELARAKLIIAAHFELSVGSLTDPAIKSFLATLIAQLGWPLAHNIDQWLCTLMAMLALKTKRAQLLLAVCEENIDGIMRLLLQHTNAAALSSSSSGSRHEVRASLNVLSFFLINYQHSAKLFHKACARMVKLLERLKADGEWSSDAYQQLALLAFVCMQRFAGYPHLYKPILDFIQNDVDLSGCDSFRAKFALDIANINYENLSTGRGESGSGEASDIASDDDHSEKLRKNVSGLVNLSNTCYLNSVVQCLFSCKKFVRKVLNIDQADLFSSLTSSNTTSVFLVQLQILFAFMYFTERKVTKPSDFVKACTPSWFRLGQQQDSSEFLVHLMDNLNEECKRLKSDSAMCNLIRHSFGMQLTTECQCSRCGTTTARNDTSFYLPLSFNHQQQSSALPPPPPAIYPSLQSLVDKFFDDELLSASTENPYDCATCGSLQTANKRTYLTRSDIDNNGGGDLSISPPDYLILTLNRFKFNVASTAASSSSPLPPASATAPAVAGVSITHTKIMDRLDYPLDLCLKTVLRKSNAALDQPHALITEHYTLNSVVVHSGSSLHYGHYYAYVRNDVGESANNEWLLVNDAAVSALNSYESLVANLNMFKDDTPYILAYKRKSSTSADETPFTLKNKNLLEFIEQDNRMFEMEERSRRPKRKIVL